MNWESIIISVSSSIIVGIITVIGNILVIKFKSKTKKNETENEYEHEYIMKRFTAYNKLVFELQYTIEHYKEIHTLKDSKFWNIYADCHLYLSDNVIRRVKYFIDDFEKNEKFEHSAQIVIDYMKDEIRTYYHLKEEKRLYLSR